MFGKQTIIVFLGVIAASRAIDPSNICFLVKDGTKITNVDQCGAFFVCNGGKAMPVCCPTDFYFSKDSQTCLPKAQVSCNSDTTANLCESVAGEKFISMPGSCSGYYHCSNSVASAGYCPGDLVFNPIKEVCSYKSEYGCSTGELNTDDPDAICAFVPNGVFFGSSTKCDIWQKCIDNKVKSGTCLEFVFNVQTSKCDYADNYDCPQLNGEDTGTALPVACTNEEEVIANPNSCSGYLRCDGTKYSALKCTGSLYFDTSSGKCVNPEDAINDCNRCEGTTKKFANLYQDGCTGYAVCSGGKSAGTGECPKGQFFNEVSGGCTKTNPEYKVCIKP